MKQSLPNLLTLLRIVMIPIIFLNLYFAHEHAYYYLFASIAFITASISDFADGYFARIWKAQSKLGQFLDPIADKLIIVTSIVMLIYAGKINNNTITPCLIIILREILISSARDFMGNVKVEIPVSYIGKIKTTVQMIGISIIMVNGSNIFSDYNLLFKLLQPIGEATLWVAAILTIYSGYNYFVIPINYFTKKKNNS